MLQLALNRMAAPNFPLKKFSGMVGALGCAMGDLRNNLATGLLNADSAGHAVQGIVQIPQTHGTVPEVGLHAADYCTGNSRYHRPKSNAFEVKTLHRNRMPSTGRMR
ncbi:hypothetical protein [Litoreibacter halocynthiae]|uniref:hypothetical protein n=1 Tax=Litoreibacter halocynthiae TaxID=1242689 RepID=UPI00249381DF|nr:hypothetical protein [Litoreibacter halocynthiae]